MGWVGSEFFLAESQSRLYPHMRAKVGRDPTSASKKVAFKFISRFHRIVLVVHSLVKLDCLPSRAVIWLYLGLTPVCHSRSYCLREVSCDRVWRGLCSGA